MNNKRPAYDADLALRTLLSRSHNMVWQQPHLTVLPFLCLMLAWALAALGFNAILGHWVPARVVAFLALIGWVTLYWPVAQHVYRQADSHPKPQMARDANWLARAGNVIAIRVGFLCFLLALLWIGGDAPTTDQSFHRVLADLPNQVGLLLVFMISTNEIYISGAYGMGHELGSSRDVMRLYVLIGNRLRALPAKLTVLLVISNLLSYALDRLLFTGAGLILNALVMAYAVPMTYLIIRHLFFAPGKAVA